MSCTIELIVMQVIVHVLIYDNTMLCDRIFLLEGKYQTYQLQSRLNTISIEDFINPYYVPNTQLSFSKFLPSSQKAIFDRFA